MAIDYVVQHDEAYWIASTRVLLDSVVYASLEGLSPESIADSFDTLTLEEVYGALAFYRANLEGWSDSWLLHGSALNWRRRHPKSDSDTLRRMCQGHVYRFRRRPYAP
jgi:uncharacterized protein DUF433